MTIVSLYQVDFIPLAGDAIRLLDFGDEMDSELSMPIQAEAGQDMATGATWARPFAQGSGHRTISWTRWQDHASLPASRDFCHFYAAGIPLNIEGKLRIGIQDGPAFDHQPAVIVSARAVPSLDSSSFETISSFQVVAGQTVPASDVDPEPGLLIGELLEIITTMSTVRIEDLGPGTSPGPALSIGELLEIIETMSTTTIENLAP